MSSGTRRGCGCWSRSTPTKGRCISPTRTRCTSRRCRSRVSTALRSCRSSAWTWTSPSGSRWWCGTPTRRTGWRRLSTAGCSCASRARARNTRGSAAWTARRASARPSSISGAGLRFNSPNDVVAASDGSIWFTDPSYGHLQGFKPEPMVGDFVYRYDPASEQVTVVADSFDKPNGLAFSPDERVLYVTDSGANQEPGQLPRRSPTPHQGIRRDRRPQPRRRAAARRHDARDSRTG